MTHTATRYSRTPDFEQCQQNIKSYIAELGINNAPTVRKATPEELAEFAGVKGFAVSEADKYRIESCQNRRNDYGTLNRTGKATSNPDSSKALLKNQNKLL